MASSTKIETLRPPVFAKARRLDPVRLQQAKAEFDKLEAATSIFPGPPLSILFPKLMAPCSSVGITAASIWPSHLTLSPPQSPRSFLPPPWLHYFFQVRPHQRLSQSSHPSSLHTQNSSHHSLWPLQKLVHAFWPSQLLTDLSEANGQHPPWTPLSLCLTG